MPNEIAQPADKRILVVDDEADVLRYQATVLEDAGFEVVTASDGDEALESVTAHPPDLISLDLVMPGKSGIRFIHALRRNRDWATIPVIIVTGHAHDDVGKRDLDSIRSGGLISGPQVCLDKPVRPDVYVSVVMERLGLAATGLAERGRTPMGVRARIDARLDEADRDTLQAVLALLEKKPAPTGDSSVSPASEGRTVLIVDDEPDVASYIAAMLTDEGYRTTTTSDPMQAVEKAMELGPDLITLDLDMPEKNGLVLYREIKAVDALRDIPVIIITGVEENMRPAFTGQPGIPDIEGYLPKPVEPARLVALVAKVLDQA
jgi:CheY-like chemotaxis protein